MYSCLMIHQNSYVQIKQEREKKTPRNYTVSFSPLKVQISSNAMWKVVTASVQLVRFIVHYTIKYTFYRLYYCTYAILPFVWFIQSCPVVRWVGAFYCLFVFCVGDSLPSNWISAHHVCVCVCDRDQSTNRFIVAHKEVQLISAHVAKRALYHILIRLYI